MTSQQLLGELGQLSHSQRMLRMQQVGRLSLQQPEVAELLSKMAGGGHYLRFMALQACFGSRDGARVLNFCQDRSRFLRGKAFSMLSLVGSNEQIAGLFPTLSATARRRFLAALRRKHRGEAIELCLQSLPLEQSEEMLAFGSARWLAQVPFNKTKSFVWARLASAHPRDVADQLRTRTVDPRDGYVVNCLAVTLHALEEKLPEEALGLARAWLAAGLPPNSLSLDWLCCRYPAELLPTLLKHVDSHEPHRLERSVAKLPMELLHECLRRGWLRAPQNWLKRLPPEARRSCYEVAGESWKDSEGLLPVALVGRLPSDLRQQEARRHLKLAVLQARPTQRLPYAAFLPWEDALTEVQPTLGDPDPDLRQASLTALVQAARYQDCLTPLLELLVARKNEQDPIRCAFLGEVADLPPAHWTPRHFKQLGQLIRDAWDAGDASHATMTQIERLLLRLLPLHPEWSSPWLIKLWRQRGHLHTYSLVQSVLPACAESLRAELPPLLEHWRDRENFNAIRQLATALDLRLKLFPEVQQELARITHDPRGVEAGAAFARLAERRSPSLVSLVPLLLSEDPSWVLQPAFCNYLHRHRQDLLNPSQTNLPGKFASGQVFGVLPVFDHFFRWTPEQQFGFASVLEKVTRDENQSATSHILAIERLSRLPAIAPKRLLELASLEEKRANVREWALRALARLDGGQGVDELLVALGDERARLAIYALRACLLEMPAEKAAAILLSTNRQKVTVAKEVLRLLGDLPNGHGLEPLLEIAPTVTHRDVRVALLRALWPHLEDERCWPLLDAAAGDPDPAIASSLASIPAANYTSETRTRLAHLLSRVLAHPDPRARSTALRSLTLFPDPGQVFLEPAKLSLLSADPAEVRQAAVLVTRLYDAPVLAALAREVLEQRRAIQALVDALSGFFQKPEPVVAVLEVLRSDPQTLPQQLNLAARSLPLADFMALVEEEMNSDPIGWDLFTGALAALPRAGDSLRMSTLTTVLERWQNSPDPRLRRLALEWLLKTGGRHGWTEPLRAALEAFRADKTAMVAGLAQFTFLPEP